MSFLCEKCATEFEDHTAYKNHRSTCGRVANVPSPDKQKKEEPIPEEKKISKIELRYEFKGVCPDCGRTISTLELDVSEKFVVMAYCVFCKKQFESREVARLEAPLEKAKGGKRI